MHVEVICCVVVVLVLVFYISENEYMTSNTYFGKRHGKFENVMRQNDCVRSVGQKCTAEYNHCLLGKQDGKYKKTRYKGQCGYDNVVEGISVAESWCCP